MNWVYSNAVHGFTDLIKHLPLNPLSKAEIRTTEGVSFVLILPMEIVTDDYDFMKPRSNLGHTKQKG
jgi:hypothetical protein